MKLITFISLFLFFFNGNLFANSIDENIEQLKLRKKLEQKKLIEAKAKLKEAQDRFKALNNGTSPDKTETLRLKLADTFDEIESYQRLIEVEEEDYIYYKQELAAYKEEKLKELIQSILEKQPARDEAKGEKIDSLTLKNGKTYKDLTLSTVTPLGISIRHSSGIARIPYLNLPDDFIQRFKFDPKEADYYQDKENYDRLLQERATTQSQKKINPFSEGNSYEERQIYRLKKRISDEGARLEHYNSAANSYQPGQSHLQNQRRNIKREKARKAKVQIRANIQKYKAEILSLEKILHERKRKSQSQ